MAGLHGVACYIENISCSDYMYILDIGYYVTLPICIPIN